MSVAKNVLLNGSATITQKVVKILDQLFLVPFFLTQWGAEYYGEWLTLTIIPSILAFSDFGVGTSVSNSFVLAYAAGDKQKAADIVKNGFYVILFTILIGILLTVSVLLIGDYFNLFAKSRIDASDAMLSVTFMMVARLFGFFNQMIEGFFRAVRKAHLSLFFSSGNNVLNIIVGIIVLFCGYGVVGFALSHLLVSITYILIYSSVGYRYIDLDGNYGVVQKNVILNLSIKGFGYMMAPIWQSIYFQGGTFVVRLTLGAESVAIFNTVRTACRSVNQLFSVIHASVLPDLQFEYGRGNMPIVHRLFRVSVLLSIVVGMVGAILLFLFGLDIYELWTQSVLSVDKSIWNIFVVGILFNSVWWTSMVVYGMANKPYFLAIVSIIMASISVGLSYLLAFQYGLLGVAIGAVMFDVVMFFIIYPNSCKLIGIKPNDIILHLKEDISAIKNILIKCRKR